MASGSVDGDSVTITTLADGVTSGALLATRPFQTGEVSATNTSVTVNVTLGPATMPQSQLIGLVDSSDFTIVRYYVGSSGEVTLDANGYDLTTCKLAIFYMNALPYEVTVNSVVGNDPVPFWIVNSDTVGESVINENIVGITQLTSAGAVEGAVLATHTDYVDDSVVGANQVVFQVYYSGSNAVDSGTFNVVDPSNNTILATFTPDSDATGNINVELDINDGVPSTYAIQLVTNSKTVANLPLYYSVTNVGVNVVE